MVMDLGVAALLGMMEDEVVSSARGLLQLASEEFCLGLPARFSVVYVQLVLCCHMYSMCTAYVQPIWVLGFFSGGVGGVEGCVCQAQLFTGGRSGSKCFLSMLGP